MNQEPQKISPRLSGAVTLAVLIIFSMYQYWESANIALVKKGILSFDQSVTVGDAINGYSWLKDVSWDEITTPQNRSIVRVSGEITDPQFVERERAGWIELLGEQNTSGSVNTVHLRVVFVINKSDETFELADGVFDEVTDQGKLLRIPFSEAVSVKLLQNIWADRKLSDAMPTQVVDQLRLQALNSGD